MPPRSSRARNLRTAASNSEIGVPPPPAFEQHTKHSFGRQCVNTKNVLENQPIRTQLPLLSSYGTPPPGEAALDNHRIPTPTPFSQSFCRSASSRYPRRPTA